MNRLRALLAGLVLLSGCAATPGQAPVVPGPVAASPTPVAVDIAKIGAHSSLIPLGVNEDNTIEVPPVSEPRQAGWYRFGPVPGEPGPAVILGHVDGNKQRGIFFRLKEIARGDEITIARSDGSVVRFTVTAIHQVAKDSFPTEAVYGDTAGPELRLITCGGSFDRAAASYRDNLIVYAVLR